MFDLFPMMRYAFAKAYVEGRRGRSEVLLREGVEKWKENSWCVVSCCSVRQELFKGKDYEIEAREEVCRRLCHWRKWQKEES